MPRFSVWPILRSWLLLSEHLLMPLLLSVGDVYVCYSDPFSSEMCHHGVLCSPLGGELFLWLSLLSSACCDTSFELHKSIVVILSFRNSFTPADALVGAQMCLRCLSLCGFCAQHLLIEVVLQ